MTLPGVGIPSPEALKQRAILNAFLLRRDVDVLGWRYDGTDLFLRFRAPPTVGWVQVHVQSTSAGEGGVTAYDPANYESSTEVDCRASAVQDVTVTLTGGERHAVWLIPVQYDAAGTKVLYDGEGASPDNMSFVGGILA